VVNNVLRSLETPPAPDFDVVIVGAGLSGIGAACHLLRECPDSTFTVLEARSDLGGTWDLFRYPGIRSDSDMFTFGYSFRPWHDSRTIADGPSILQYLRETATEYGMESHIRFGHKVVDATWNSALAQWTVTALEVDTAERVRFTCRWLSICAGYYDYAGGHRPDFEGESAFEGVVVSPQSWPADLDWTGKRVVVIGSGATAVTLVPNMARHATHVTMLQRTPTYVVSLPSVDKSAMLIKRILPTPVSSKILFWKNVLGNIASYELSRKFPSLSRWLIRRETVRALGPDYPVDTHFKPPYDPWDQRVCVVPDGDLFDAVKSHRAEIVTDTIARFVPSGVETSSGRLIEADIVVSATGLAMLPIGGIALSVDGERVALSEAAVFKGMMMSGVPNFNLVVGYTNNSWTLKADLVSEHITAILKYLDRRGYDYVVPGTPPEPATLPFVELRSGYVQRAIDAFPRQGSRTPWRLHQNYLRDLRLFRRDLDSEADLHFGRRRAPSRSIDPTSDIVGEGVTHG
jgi:cation diffusion facilitator CzcD-associated flavoprotein CzcO